MIGAAMPDPSAPVPHVVIVGGGFGGLTAARKLKRKPVRVTLVDRQNHHLFQMLLYQVATAGLSPGDIASPIRWILRRQANTRVLMADAQRVDAAGKTLITDVGPIAFDYLILAPGVTHSYFGHDEWRAHAPGLKTLDDALAIRSKMLHGVRAGRAGGVGRRTPAVADVHHRRRRSHRRRAGRRLVEIARHALRHEFRAIDSRTATVLLLEGGPHVLPAFPPELRDRARGGISSGSGSWCVRAPRSTGSRTASSTSATSAWRPARSCGPRASRRRRSARRWACRSIGPVA